MFDKLKIILVCFAILLALFALYFVIGAQVLAYFWMRTETPDDLPSTVAKEIHANLVSSERPFEDQDVVLKMERAKALWMIGSAPNISETPERMEKSFRVFKVQPKHSEGSVLFMNGKILQIWQTPDRARYQDMALVEPNFNIKYSCQENATSSFESIAHLFDTSYLVSVRCYDRRITSRLFLWDSKASDFLKIDDSAFENYLELKAGQDSWLVAYGMNRIRIAPEVDVANYTQIVLFSPTFPKGLPVARIGLNDGNLLNWYMRNQTLVMKTLARTKSGTKYLVWDLDLSKVLLESSSKN